MDKRLCQCPTAAMTRLMATSVSPGINPSASGHDWAIDLQGKGQGGELYRFVRAIWRSMTPTRHPKANWHTKGPRYQRFVDMCRWLRGSHTSWELPICMQPSLPVWCSWDALPGPEQMLPGPFGGVLACKGSSCGTSKSAAPPQTVMPQRLQPVLDDGRSCEPYETSAAGIVQRLWT